MASDRLRVVPLNTDKSGEPQWPGPDADTRHGFDWLIDQLDGVEYDTRESFVVTSEPAGEVGRAYIVQLVNPHGPAWPDDQFNLQPICTCADFRFNRMFKPGDVEDPVARLGEGLEPCKHIDEVLKKTKYGSAREEGQSALPGSEDSS